MVFGCARVLASDLLSHQPIQRPGDKGELQIEVHLQADHGGQGVQVKELDRRGDLGFSLSVR